MHPDYRDAAERHWEDASYLSADKRFANADHLYGLSAECALKAVMQGLGMPLRPDGVPMDKQNRIHINLLWDEFSTFAQSRNGARYATGINSMPNPWTSFEIISTMKRLQPLWMPLISISTMRMHPIIPCLSFGIGHCRSLIP